MTKWYEGTFEIVWGKLKLTTVSIIVTLNPNPPFSVTFFVPNLALFRNVPSQTQTFRLMLA